MLEYPFFGYEIDGIGKILKRREKAPDGTRKSNRSDETDRTRVSGAILAGGKSKRMGVEKAFIELGGSTIIERVIDTIGQIVSEIIIVTNAPEDFVHVKARYIRDLPIGIVKDIHRGIGALGGLHSGLYHAAEDQVFICACDMPFINPELVRFIVKVLDKSDAAVPVVQGFFEPLLAAYSKRCIDSIERDIEKGERQILSFYDSVKLRKINEWELRVFDRDLHSFININSPKDLIEAEKILMTKRDER